MNEQRRSSRWKSNGIKAAIIGLLLIVAYPSSAGPVTYATYRGWMPVSWYLALYDAPWRALGESAPAIWWTRYAEWWADLAMEHRRESGQ